MSPKLPKFSIVMANFNNAKYIKEAIDSVLAQSFSGWELVVVDDCSLDNSVEVIKKYHDPRIKFLQNEKNIGYIGTLKKIIKNTQGEILVILDSDDALAKNALAEIHEIYFHHPNCGFVYSQNWYCDKDLNKKHLGYSLQISEGKTNLHCNCVGHIKTFRKDIYFKTGGFDDDMLYAEDIDIIFKIEEISKLYFINKPLYYYRVLPVSQTHGFKNEMINRSSTALAKFNAYKRRVGSDILNLKEKEIAEVLFLGIFTSMFSLRFGLTKLFFLEFWKKHKCELYSIDFYKLLLSKINKIIKLKKDAKKSA